MNIQLAAIDIDGTLLNSKRELTEEVIDAVQKAVKAGVKIVLCTGRPTPGIRPYIKELGLNREEDYSITYNGGLLRRTDTEEVISKHELGYSDFTTIQNAAVDAGINCHHLHDDSIITLNKDIGYFTVYESFIAGVPLFYREMEDINKSSTFSKIMMADFPEVLERGIHKLPQSLWNDYTVLRSEPHFLEFLNKNASKGTAVKELADRLNIPQKNVMAIGDGGNDLDMIEYAGLGVAMGNATDELKDTAQHITVSNEDNGVAKAIHDFIL